MAREKWAPHMIDLLEECDNALEGILTNDDRRGNFERLKYIAEDRSGGFLSGHAAWLLHDLYDDGKFVAPNPSLSQHYLNIACAKGDTHAICEVICAEDKPFEEIDQELEDLINSGCYFEFRVWEERASLNKFKLRKLWNSYNPITGMFNRVKFRFKALRSVPKARYFDINRQMCRKAFIKSLFGLLIPTALIVLLVFFIL